MWAPKRLYSCKSLSHYAQSKALQCHECNLIPLDIAVYPAKRKQSTISVPFILQATWPMHRPRYNTDHLITKLHLYPSPLPFLSGR